MNTSSEWTRNIHGINGSLAAIQNNSETPVLQFTDLHGDIIATASPSETETKLLSTSEASEFGVPTTSTPAKYSWLGAEQQPTELPSGEIAMGARSYIPQLGRFLQPDPRPSGSANAYSYTFGDPVNTSDPSGEFTVATPTWSIELNDREAQQATEAAEAAIRKAAEEAAARAAAEAAAQAAAAAAAAAGPAAAPEGPLGGSAGWACEYAAETGQEAEGCGPSSAEMAEIFGCTGDNACASSIFGAVVHWVSSNAHKLVASGIGAVSSLVIGAVTLVAVTACGTTAELTEDPFVAYDCYKIGSIGFSMALAGAASAVDAWKVEKN